MKLGMPTLIELPSLADTAALCDALRLDFIELNMNLPAYQPDRLAASQLRVPEGFKGYFTMHLDENLNVWDFNPLVADAYLETVLRTIRFAKRVDAPILNMHMHPGVYFTLPDEKVFLFDVHRDVYLERTQQFRQACEQEIGAAGITICLENCGGFTGFQREALDCLLESPTFGLTLDVGHAHSAGNTDLPFYQAWENRVVHMHLHDGNGAQNHLAIGAGEIDFTPYLLHARARDCRCVLETKTVVGLRQSVEALRVLAARLEV